MFESADAICPYFRSLSKNDIRCEGIAPCTNTQLHFSRKGASDKYCCKYCESYEYTKCMIAKMLNTKYEA